MFSTWRVARSEYGREGNSLLICESDLDDILLAHTAERRQSSSTVASKFELIKPEENIQKGLNPTAKTLNDRYEYQAQLICQDLSFVKLRDKILHLLASGNSPAKVQKLIGTDEEVVRRVRHANPDAVKNIKQHLSMQMAEATQVLTEELLDRVHEIPAEHLGRALQVTFQAHQIYSGGYTARVEHRTVATPEDLQKMFDSLPSLEVTQIEDVKNADDSSQSV
jgi:hypothetical protein